MDLKDGEELPLPASIDIAALQDAALKNIYEGYAEAVEPHLHQITYEAMSIAIGISFEPNSELMQALTESGSWFAANKSWLVANKLAKLLVDKKGTKVGFAAFKKASEPILGDYNTKYLRTEYNTAVRSARIASNWEKWAKDSDIYPNLEYIRSRAANPREQHLQYVGIIRPFGDPFWKTHTPPLDWNCLCSLRQTDKAVTETGADLPRPANGLGHNVAMSQELFGSSHPYFRRVPKSVREDIQQWNDNFLGNG